MKVKRMAFKVSISLILMLVLQPTLGAKNEIMSNECTEKTDDLIVTLPVKFSDDNFHNLTSWILINDQFYYLEESLLYPIREDKPLKVNLFNFNPGIVNLINDMMQSGDRSLSILVFVDSELTMELDVEKLINETRNGENDAYQMLGQRVVNKKYFPVQENFNTDLNNNSMILAAGESCPPNTLATCTEFYEACISECTNDQCIKYCKNLKANCIRGYTFVKSYTETTLIKGPYISRQFVGKLYNNGMVIDCYLMAEHKMDYRVDTYEDRLCFFTQQKIKVLTGTTYYSLYCQDMLKWLLDCPNNGEAIYDKPYYNSCNFYAGDPKYWKRK